MKAPAKTIKRDALHLTQREIIWLSCNPKRCHEMLFIFDYFLQKTWCCGYWHVIVNFQNTINPFVLHQVTHAMLMLEMMKAVLVPKTLNLLHFFLLQREKWKCIRATKSTDCSKKTYFTKALSMPAIMVCSGLIVDTALDIYIPSGKHNMILNVVWSLTIGLLPKERELILNRVLNFNLHTMNFHMKAAGKSEIRFFW